MGIQRLDTCRLHCREVVNEVESAKTPRVVEQQPAGVKIEARAQVLGVLVFWQFAVRGVEQYACHAQVDQQPARTFSGGELDGHAFADAPCASELRAFQTAQVQRLELNVEQVSAAHGVAAQLAIQAAGDSFDFRQFGHC